MVHVGLRNVTAFRGKWRKESEMSSVSMQWEVRVQGVRATWHTRRRRKMEGNGGDGGRAVGLRGCSILWIRNSGNRLSSRSTVVLTRRPWRKVLIVTLGWWTSALLSNRTNSADKIMEYILEHNGKWQRQVNCFQTMLRKKQYAPMRVQPIHFIHKSRLHKARL